jgi:hypothetical protein
VLGTGVSAATLIVLHMTAVMTEPLMIVVGDTPAHPTMTVVVGMIGGMIEAMTALKVQEEGTIVVMTGLMTAHMITTGVIRSELGVVGLGKAPSLT